jgi:hypothetical protein
MHALALLTSLTTVTGVFGASISNATLQGSLSHPSQSVTLIYPDSRLQHNQTMAIGVVNPSSGDGFLGNISVTATYPNDTSLHLGSVVSDCTASTASTGTFTYKWFFITDAIGK